VVHRIRFVFVNVVVVVVVVVVVARNITANILPLVARIGKLKS